MTVLKTMTHDTAAAAEPLPFGGYPRRRAIIHMSYHGVNLELELADVRTEDVEKLVDSLLAREGWAFPASAPTAQRRARVERIEPFYDGEGTACCPKHKKPLKQGQYGLYCSAKDPEGPRGYCNLKFSE